MRVRIVLMLLIAALLLMAIGPGAVASGPTAAHKVYLPIVQNRPVIQLVSPANGGAVAERVPELVFDIPRTDDWADYQVGVSPDPAFPSSATTWIQTSDSDAVNYRIHARPYENVAAGRNYWKVYSWKLGITSAVWSFTAPSGGTPPAAPVLISPAEGAVFPQGPVDITFQWAPVSGATRYLLDVQYIFTDGRPALTGGGEPPTWVDGTSASRYYVFSVETHMMWRVSAYNGLMLSDPSPWRYFSSQP